MDLDNVTNNSEGVMALSVDKPPPHATKVVYKQVHYRLENMADSIIPHQAQVRRQISVSMDESKVKSLAAALRFMEIEV